MTGNEARTVNQLRRLASAQEDDSLLLARFLTDMDAEAFAELVRRHGPMVLGVCRRVLGAGPDADDAFQAAFIVLARRGSSVRNGRSVASFLFGVARFAALRARDKARRRREHEAQAGREPRGRTETDPDLLAAVDEELQRLPDRYRAPLVSCFLLGRTQEEAARETGCSLSTLRRRLERGQELLRKRLLGRGVTPALGTLGVGVGSANVSATVVETTTALVVAVVTGKVGSDPGTLLAEGVIAMMARTKFTALVAALVVAGLVGGGVVWQLAAAQPPEPSRASQRADTKTKPPEPPTKVADGPAKDKDAKPVEDRIKLGDRLIVRVRNALVIEPIDGPFEVEASGKIALGPTYGRVKIDGLTLEEAETAIFKHLKQTLREPLVSVTRYRPPDDRALELRVQRLEKEIKQLQFLIEELRNKKP
jgi:RNA polymerase sigma factor (sigma-70 family)